MAKVLLVEDDNNLREIYQARLMAEGYDIVAAQNGEEALVVAKQNKPDLIISDVMMPRISGFEMLDILRNTEGLKHTPVIMLTALGQSEDQKRADNLGANKYLVKSQVTLEDIVSAAKNLLDTDGTSQITDVPPPPEVTQPATPVEAPTAPVPTPVAAPAPEPSTSPAPVPEPTTPPAPAPEPTAPEPTLPTPPPAPAPEPTVVPEPVAPTAPATNPSPAPEPSAAPAPTLVPVTPAPPIAPAPVPEPTTPPAPDPALTAPEPTLPTPPPAPAPEPTVVPEPVAPSAPETTSEVAEPADTVAAEAAVSDAATQTMEAEEKALQEQIENYAKEPGVDPAAVEPTNASDAEAKVDAQNEAAINQAVEQLDEATPEPAGPIQPPSIANAEQVGSDQSEPSTSPAPVPEPTTPPAPDPAPTAPEPTSEPASKPEETPETTSDNVSVAGKKVIKPLNDPTSAPKIQDLLAKEVASQPPAPAAPVVDGTVAQPTNTPPAGPGPAMPGQTFDPNTVAL